MSIQRQYEIERGPFLPAPALPNYLALTDAQTNLSYLQQNWMGGALPISLLFSEHRFSTENFQTAPGQKSLWVVNLKPMHFGAFQPGQGQLVDIRPSTVPLPAGTISHLSWDKEYVFQPVGLGLGILIRLVNRTPVEDDGIPPVHRWGGNPALWLPEARAPDMPGLLSRLHALTDT